MPEKRLDKVREALDSMEVDTVDQLKMAVQKGIVSSAKLQIKGVSEVLAEQIVEAVVAVLPSSSSTPSSPSSSTPSPSSSPAPVPASNNQTQETWGPYRIVSELKASESRKKEKGGPLLLAEYEDKRSGLIHAILKPVANDDDLEHEAAIYEYIQEEAKKNRAFPPTVKYFEKLDPIKGDARKHKCIVLEYDPESISLTKLLRSKPSDSIKLMVASNLCEAVASLHSYGIAHLDLKPDNILVQPQPGKDYNVLLMDMDSARPFQAGLVIKNSPWGNRFASDPVKGTLLYTAQYVCPEVAMFRRSTSSGGRGGKEATTTDIATKEQDLFNLGLILAEICMEVPEPVLPLGSGEDGLEQHAFDRGEEEFFFSLCFLLLCDRCSLGPFYSPPWLVS